jgi:hypothetical protein
MKRAITLANLRAKSKIFLCGCEVAQMDTYGQTILDEKSHTSVPLSS